MPFSTPTFASEMWRVCLPDKHPKSRRRDARQKRRKQERVKESSIGQCNDRPTVSAQHGAKRGWLGTYGFPLPGSARCR